MSHPYQLRSTDTHTVEGRPSGAGAVRSLASSELAEEMETYHSHENRTARVSSPTPQLSTTIVASPEAVEQSQPQSTVTSSSTASHGPVDDERPSKVLKLRCRSLTGNLYGLFRKIRSNLLFRVISFF